MGKVSDKLFEAGALIALKGLLLMFWSVPLQVG
jgi:hypothetical protein